MTNEERRAEEKGDVVGDWEKSHENTFHFTNREFKHQSYSKKSREFTIDGFEEENKSIFAGNFVGLMLKNSSYYLKTKHQFHRVTPPEKKYQIG